MRVSTGTLVWTLLVSFRSVFSAKLMYSDPECTHTDTFLRKKQRRSQLSTPMTSRSERRMPATTRAPSARMSSNQPYQLHVRPAPPPRPLSSITLVDQRQPRLRQRRIPLTPIPIPTPSTSLAPLGRTHDRRFSPRRSVVRTTQTRNRRTTSTTLTRIRCPPSASYSRPLAVSLCC